MKATQHTPKTIPVKKLSDNDLSELADLFFHLVSRINDYRHVTESGEITAVIKAIETKQDQVLTEIERREDLNY